MEGNKETETNLEKEIETVLKENNFEVEKEKRIKGYLTDLVGKKSGKMVIIEIKKNKPILTSSVINLYQLKKKFKNNYHFALVSDLGVYEDVGSYADKMQICVYRNKTEFSKGLKGYLQKN